MSSFRQRANRRLYRLLYGAYRAAFRTVSPHRLRPAELRRALIIRNDAVGDLIVTTPVLSFLAQVAPDAQVDVLASRSNYSLIAGDQRVHHCYLSPTTAGGWLALFRALRARRYDVIYSLRYGRAMREGLISSLAAGPTTQKISVFRPKRYHGLFTRLVRTPRRATHMAERLLHVAASALDLGPDSVDVSVERYPIRLTSSRDADNLAAGFLDAKGVTEFVVVNFSAREAERDWPAAGCARVVSDLAKRHPDLAFVIIAPALRRGEAEAIAAASSSSRVVVFPPSSNLLVIAALVRRARITITPDTAAVHVAAATGCPVLGLYLQLKTRLWLPLAVPHRILQANSGSPIASIPDTAIIDAFEQLWSEAVARPSNR